MGKNLHKLLSGGATASSASFLLRYAEEDFIASDQFTRRQNAQSERFQ